MKVGVLYICTGKYIQFWESFYQSCEQYFLPNICKEYIVFTDADEIYSETNMDNIHLVYQAKLGWPLDTLMRYHMFINEYDRLIKYDYLFFFNANALFMNYVGAEFLPTIEEKLVGVIHPGFYNRNNTDFTYDRNKQSTAYIPYGKGTHYYCGGVNGGISEAFLLLSKILSENINKDLERGIIALWHDESHINRYFIDNPPKTLDSSYAYPEHWNIPFVKKIMIKDKSHYGGHQYLRESSALDSDDLMIPTYVVNMKDRTDRLNSVKQQFEGKSEFDVHIVEAEEHLIGAVGLWNSIKKVIQLAVTNDDDVIVFCEDDHVFTANYNKEKMFDSIMLAAEKGADTLNLGVGGVNQVVPINENLFWVDNFWCTQFIVIYRSFFEKILNEPFNDDDTADGKFSAMTGNNFLLFPFMSVQKDFGYSDVTNTNNNKGHIEQLFENSEKHLQEIQSVYKKYVVDVK